jgi:hypothetical protein
MAARTRKGTKDKPWPEVTRERIQASMLINRLQSHVLGDCDMKPTQVQAALGLLKKAMPDLQSVESKSEVTVHNVVRLPAPKATADEWLAGVQTNH